jgi:hypothetical protein
MTSARANRIVIICILLFPALVNVFGDAKMGQRLLHVATIPLLCLLVLLRRTTASARIPRGIVAFTCAAIAYYLGIAVFQTQGLDLAGIVDVGRPLIYLAYLLFPFFFPLDDAQFESFVTFLTICALVQIGFSALVYVPSMSPLQDVFKGRLSNDPVLFHHFRWSGTLAWPSDFSFFLSVFIYFAYLQVLGIAAAAARFRWALLALALGVGVLFTTSRGGLATVVVMVGLATVIFGRLWHTVIVGVMVAAAASAIIYAADVEIGTGTELRLNYVTRLLDSSEEVDGSTGHRIHELRYASDVALEHFPFGIGPDRGEIDHNLRVVESLYGHHLIKWGFIGLGFYVLATGYTLLQLWRGARNATSVFSRNFCLAVLLWAISVPLVFGWSSAVTDRFKCLPLYHFIVGHVWATWALRRARAPRDRCVLESHASGSIAFPPSSCSEPGRI